MSRPRKSAALHDLPEILRATPDMAEAACIGRAKMFDPDDGMESPHQKELRHTAATRVCQSCPVLRSCRAWADALPEFELFDQVVAGEVRRGPKEFLTEPRLRRRSRK